jgi:hypothetical protein
VADDELARSRSGSRRSSRERRALANLAVAYSAIGVDLAELAGKFDGLEGDDRRGKLLSLSAELGNLGDKAHETRRALRDLAMKE